MTEPWTPGPWGAQEGRVWAPNDDPNIASNWGCVAQIWRSPQEDADARLISLAPEMAELLVRMTEAPWGYDSIGHHVADARALLARARGEA